MEFTLNGWSRGDVTQRKKIAKVQVQDKRKNDWLRNRECGHLKYERWAREEKRKIEREREKIVEMQGEWDKLGREKILEKHREITLFSFSRSCFIHYARARTCACVRVCMCARSCVDVDESKCRLQRVPARGRARAHYVNTSFCMRLYHARQMVRVADSSACI